MTRHASSSIMMLTRRGMAPPFHEPPQGAFAVESEKAAAPFRPHLGETAATEARNLRDTMTEATIRLRIERLAGGGFLATSPDVPGLVAEGRSVAEATEIAQGLARKIAESCIEHGDPLPPALTRLQERETGLDLLVPVSVP